MNISSTTWARRFSSWFGSGVVAPEVRQQASALAFCSGDLLKWYFPLDWLSGGVFLWQKFVKSVAAGPNSDVASVTRIM